MNEFVKVKNEEKLQVYLSNAQTLISAGDFKLARKILTQGIYEGMPAAELLYFIAETYLQENNEEKAERVLRDSIAYQPTAQAYFVLSKILVSQEKFDRAIQSLKRCLELKNISMDEKFELYQALGNIYMKMDQLPNALKSYEKTLEIKENEESHCHMGSCLLRLRNLNGAKKHFMAAMNKNPKSGKPYFGLASCALGIGNKKAAFEFFMQCLERDIQHPTALFYLIKCAFELKKFNHVDQILRQYLDVSPVNSSLLYSLAGVQYHLGKKEELAETIQQLLSIHPEHAGALRLRNLTTS